VEKTLEGSYLEKAFIHFARNHIADHPEYFQLHTFPEGLWKKISEDKLFGVGIDQKFNGHGKNAGSISLAGTVLVEHGGNLGIGLSWLIHEMIAKWLFAFGTPEQKQSYLPLLAAGKKTACFAVSEPEVGAHPKFISTTAKKTADGYALNGEKTYLTNGPIADFFIVIAITDYISDRKQFTAFILAKDTPGLKVSEPMALPFLRPSPHGSISISNCKVSPDQILGNIDTAYDEMVLPFRLIEDTMMMGPIVGGLRNQFRLLVDLLKIQNITPEDDVLLEIANFYSTLEAFSVIAIRAAETIDYDIENTKLAPITLFFRKQAVECLETLKNIITKTNVKTDDRYLALENDLSAITRIAENAVIAKTHKLGKSFFK